LKLIKRIQECKNYGEARLILDKVGARANTKKLIETTFTLASSDDPSDHSNAAKLIKRAFKELEKEGLDDKEIHEEELSNKNTGERTDGSEQSTQNDPPYSGEGKDSTAGEKAMQDLDGSLDQWSEAHPAAGTPGVAPPPGAGIMPPNQSIMPPQQQPPNQMAGPPGAMPPMGGQMDPQMQQYIQSLFNQEMQNYHNQVTNKTKETMGRVVSQLTVKSHQQKEAIKILSRQLREAITSANSNNMDLEYMRKNSNASIRETVPILNGFAPGGFGNSRSQDKIYSKRDKLDQARREITEMNNILKSGR